MQDVVLALIQRKSDDKIYIQQRRSNQSLAGKWEFPAGKVEPGEGLIQALRRELREEIGTCNPITGIKLAQRDVTFPHGSYRLHVFQVELFEEPRPQEGQTHAWISRDEAPGWDLLDVDHEIIRDHAR